jgi:type VI secretion system FHA domain protein
MALRLQIVSRHQQGLGERSAKEFGHAGGTIGRSLESDWVLPDGQRYLSSRHASIDYRSGSYYIVDTSTNGVYVNDAEQPVGRGNPQRLFGGDRIRIGEYEMSVEIVGEDDTGDHLTTGEHEDPVDRAQRVPPPDPTRADLVPAHEITAVGIEWMISEEADPGDAYKVAANAAAGLRLEEDPPPPAHTVERTGESRYEPPPVSAAARLAKSLKPAVKPKAPAIASATPAAPIPPVRSAPAAPSVEPVTRSAAANAAATGSNRPPPAPGSGAALDAFFRGAGLPAQKLDDRLAEHTLQRLGQVMREVILGMTENLHLRAEQKSELRIPTTTIQPQRNNPLKFSASIEEALTNLLFRQSVEYLSAVDAIRETFGDIKQHQQNLLAATRTAVRDYIDRLDPDELESKFSNNKRGLMNAANKLKYWDLFKDLYQVVAQGQRGQFPQQFLEEFTRAYEQEESRSTPPASATVLPGPGSKVAS